MEEKHIVSFSGGKDSTAMLLIMIEKGMKIDEIVFMDTTAEYPEMYEHIEKVEKMINRKITRIEFDSSFNFYMLEYVRKKGPNKGRKGYGWCGGMCRWGTALKTQIFNRYMKKFKGTKVIVYQGIAADEPQRLDKNKKQTHTPCYPLVTWGKTEKDCLEYCYNKGFDFGNLYEHLDRVSCWCCRNKNLKELKNYYYHLPQYWDRLKELQKKIDEPYRADYSLEELEQRFEREGLQIKIS